MHSLLHVVVGKPLTAWRSAGGTAPTTPGPPRRLRWRAAPLWAPPMLLPSPALLPLAPAACAQLAQAPAPCLRLSACGRKRAGTCKRGASTSEEANANAWHAGTHSAQSAELAVAGSSPRSPAAHTAAAIRGCASSTSLSSLRPRHSRILPALPNMALSLFAHTLQVDAELLIRFRMCTACCCCCCCCCCCRRRRPRRSACDDAQRPDDVAGRDLLKRESLEYKCDSLTLNADTQRHFPSASSLTGRRMPKQRAWNSARGAGRFLFSVSVTSGTQHTHRGGEPRGSGGATGQPPCGGWHPCPDGSGYGDVPTRHARVAGFTSRSPNHQWHCVCRSC